MNEKNTFVATASLETKDIEDATRQAALACYGIVAICKREEISRLELPTKKGNSEDAIYVNKKPNRTFTIDVYLVLSNEVKITEALAECQKNIMYILSNKYNQACTGVNVYGEKILASH